MLGGKLTCGRKLLRAGLRTRLMSCMSEHQPERGGTQEGSQHTQSKPKSLWVGWISSSATY